MTSSTEASPIRGSLVSYLIGNILMSRVVPASFFTVMMVFKATGVAEHLASAGEGPLAQSAWLFIVQQGLTILFLSMVVVLFIIRKPTVGKRSSFLGGVVALAGSFILSIPLGAPVVETNQTTMLMSTVMLLFGNLFSIVSILHLGRCFGIMPEARGLVTSGPYSYVRHPLYVGETIAAVGSTVATVSLPLLGLVLVYCGLQFWRAINEEAALGQVFPEYDEYMKRTARFVPGIY